MITEADIEEAAKAAIEGRHAPRFRKRKGYRFEGVICGVAMPRDGRSRVIVEHDDGWLFIFNPADLERAE